MYEGFAAVYDMFMDDVPYDAWADYIIRRLHREGIRDGLILDLGCGTGQITRRLADAGYDMIGVDLSAEMLQAAQAYESSDPKGILYLMQDMRSFELYGTVRAIISTCDSLNYMTQEADLISVFRLVNNYLDPGGLFLFDLHTPYYYAELCGEGTFAESRDEGGFIWENHFDESTGINEYDLTLFVQHESGLFERFCETHTEKAWTPEEIICLLKEAGLIPAGTSEGYREEPADEASERMMFFAYESGKQQE